MAIDFSRPDHRSEDDVLDLELVAWDATDDGWVTVAAAAAAAGVGTGTVRHWYRTGRLPTHRSSGEKGAFLVRLDAVLALAHEVEMDAATESLRRQLDDFSADPTWLDLPLAEAAGANRPAPEPARALPLPAQWGGTSDLQAPADVPPPAAPAAWGGAGAAESGGGDPAPAPTATPAPAPAAWADLADTVGRADRLRLTNGHGFRHEVGFVLGHQPDDLLPRVEKRHLLR